MQPQQISPVVVAAYVSPEAAAQNGQRQAQYPVVGTPLAERGWCLRSCGVTAAVAMHMTFGLVLMFCLLWGQAGGEVSVGWKATLGAQWALNCVELTLAIVEFSCLGGSSFMAYWVSAAGLAASAASNMLMLLFVAAVHLDYSSKCDHERDLSQRTLGVAFPFDCDPGGVLSMTSFFVFFISVPCAIKVCIACCTGARCRWHAHDLNISRQSGLQRSLLAGAENREAQPPPLFKETDSGKFYCLLAAVLLCVLGSVGVGLAGFFLTPHSGTTKAPAGKCPSFNSSSGGGGGGGSGNSSAGRAEQALIAQLFRPQPMIGTELPNCAWRTWEGGSCVRYPYDYKAFGRTSMSDPLSGRVISQGNGETNCSQLLGLLSCSPYRYGCVYN